MAQKISQVVTDQFNWCLCLAKVVESVFGNEISKYFCLFTPLQFGFSKFNYTSSRVLREIITIFKNNTSAQAILYDPTKTFDCIGHNILNNKLQHYGLYNKYFQYLKDVKD